MLALGGAVAVGVAVPATAVARPTAAAPLPLEPPPADAAPLEPPVAAPPVPPDSDGHRFLRPGPLGPVTWDPCRPVRYVVRDAGAPPGGREQVAAAFTQLGAATGLAFVDAGDTDEAPAAVRAVLQPDRYGDGWVPLLVAWSDPGESPELAGRTAAYALPSSFDADGRGERWVSGQVVLDRPQLAGPAAGPGTPAVLLHELGHLAGLDHVEDPADTMHAGGAAGTGYTPGALEGLRRLGLGPCAPSR